MALPYSRFKHFDEQMLETEEEERLSNEALQASANAREEFDRLRSDLTKCRQDLSKALKRATQADDKLKEVEETLRRWKQSHSDAAAEAEIYRWTSSRALFFCFVSGSAATFPPPICYLSS